MPPVRPLQEFVLLLAIQFLDLADKLVVIPFDLQQIGIGKLAPLLFQLAFELRPFPLELFSIHRIFLLMLSIETPSSRWRQVITPETVGQPDFSRHATFTVRPVTRWIATRITPIRNRIQEIWTATADTPARFRAPAIKPTTRNTSA